MADAIATRLRAAGRPDRAGAERRYLKSDLGHLGTGMGEVRAAVRDAWRASPPDRSRLLGAAAALWSPPVHELRAAAIVLLARGTRLLTVEDLARVEAMLREARTWALVDPLATDVAGPIAGHEPVAAAPTLDRWSTDADEWLRRASLLVELRPLRSGAPFAPFAGRADALLDERGFFIRKAIGWVLREVGRRRPDEVVDWLAPRTHRASGVTMREAVKYLPAADGERLMAAYREGRPAG